MGIIKRLQKQERGRDFVFTAIDKLKDEEEITKFYEEYIEWLRRNGSKEVRENLEKTASENIGYTLGYYDRSTKEKWWKVLPNVRHPLFGRLPSISQIDAFKAGEIMAEKGVDAAKEYIKRRYAY